jgi:hypothetical protein
MALVRIPFRRENAQLISDSATLDGRPIQAQWEADGAAIVFEVDEPGNYRLELGFRPASRGLGASNGFEMSIPRLAQSRLELTIPHEMPGIEAQSAIGAVQLETDPPRLSAELGPSNRLAVHWPETPAKGAAAADIDIDQLMWLKVQPGSVVVDARFKFHIPADQVRRLQIATDPRLRLLPLQGKDAPNVQIRSDGAKKQIVTILWNRPLTEESALDLSFLLTGASGVGKFRLPQIEVLDARTAKRWVAISVNPILEYKSQRSPNLVAAATGEFLKNWGSANSPPAQAYRLESDKVDWSLSTRPREPETSAQQTLALSFDQNNVEAYFDAQLTVASGYVFQYQLSAPAAMKVLKASVCKEGVEQASRCSQDQDGTITIFLTGPADGKQQLSLHGIMPLESGEKMPLPDIKLKQCRVQSTTVQVSRRPEVNLELILPENINSLLQKSPLPTNLRSVPGEGQGEGLSDLTERGRLVDAFRLEGDNPVQGAARLTANRPNIDAKQVTRLYQDGQQWTARTDFLLDVTEGVADGFWIEAPKSWKEPYTVDPPATLKITEIPGETRQLLVQPRSAVRGKYHFSISGALEIEPGEPPAAPEIILRKTKAYLRWYILPRQLKGQPASWETRGLLPSELPAALATPADRKDSFAYEIVSDAPRAVLRAQTVPSSIAKVSIADIQLAWQADGTGFGTAVFDLEPGGQRFCLLNLPDGSELVHVSIDEQPAAPISLEPGKWKLPLVSERLPQRIEVLFRGTLSDPLRSGPRNFIAPSLGNLPVTQTLWTILSPPSLGPEIGNEEKTATLNRQQLIRFRNTAATITSAENLLLSDDAEETLRWYQIKSRRLTSAQVTLQNELALMPVSESSEKLHKEIETIDQQQNEFAKRIGLTKVLTQVKAESPAYGDSTDVWQQWLGEQRHAARYAVDGKALSITVNYQSVEHIGPLGRIAASLCLAGVVFIFILGIRHGTWTTLLENRPYAIGIAAGLAWWCWLWPSILGLIAMIVCLIVCRRARRREAAL